MSQRALFELPPAVNGRLGEPALPIPKSLRDLLDEGVPGEVVAALVRELGGRVVCVPAPDALCERHAVVRALGIEGATILARQLGGPNARFCVPRGVAMLRAVRDEAIRRDSDSGVGMAELVRRYGLTERAVWGVLGRG